jgi:BirA family biotin operon repressor/biotin-[acetyl-CoA-carboxylase] ligase
MDTGEETGTVDELAPSSIGAGLSTVFLGHQVVYYPVAASTNAVASDMARHGAADGTLVITDEQTAGRGRLDRSWFAPQGTSLLFSLLLRPRLPARLAQQLTMLCGLGVRESVRQCTGLPAQLKWPNDIMLGHRKAGGILTEVSTLGERLEYAIVGIGLNVNLPTSALPAEFHATSIAHECGHAVSRLQLLQHALRSIEQRYVLLLAGQSPLAEWRAALDTLGQRVQIHSEQEQWEGLAIGVDDEGALLLRLDDGRTKRMLVGDIVSAHEH